MFIIIFGWLPLCIAAGMFASIRRNRSGFGWFLFAFFLSPFLAFIFIAILQSKPDRIRISREPPVETVGEMCYDAVASELEV